MISGGLRWFAMITDGFRSGPELWTTNFLRQNKALSHMEPSRAASDPILLRFASRFAFRSRCGLVLGPFGSLFGSFWIRFGSVLVSFWVDFGLNQP